MVICNTFLTKSQNFAQKGLIGHANLFTVGPFGWLHQAKHHMYKMYFRKYMEKDIPACVQASNVVSKKNCEELLS